jgi:hypothetical protein
VKVRPGLPGDINCTLVAQTPLSDIEGLDGECWSLESLHFFAFETIIDRGNLTPRDLICFGHKIVRSI